MKIECKHKLLFVVFLLIVFSMPLSARGAKEEISGLPQASAVSEQAEPVSSYPPPGWVTDIGEARKTAMAEDKNILINFTGSDWCVWCKRLSKEVFSTAEFREYAEKHLVLLYVDFPSSIELSDEQTLHNNLLGQLLGVQGYPTIWLLDKDLNPLLSTGYRAGGFSEYIRHLEEDRPEVSQDEREQFRAGFTAALEANLGTFR